jgi:two-component system, NarL family, nitrate/nitrite response regulator NarL
MGAIRIVLIDREPVVRAGLRLLLSDRPNLTVVAEADGCERGLRAIVRREPDVAIVALDQFDDAEVGRLAEGLVGVERTRLLAVSNSEDPDAILRAVRAGALGLVGRDEPVATLAEAVASVHASEAWYRRRSVATILTTLLRANPEIGADPAAARFKTLTRREREIVRLLSEGLKNRAIAERLFISEITVRHHLTNIFEKLGVANRFELLRLAHRGDAAA